VHASPQRLWGMGPFPDPLQPRAPRARQREQARARAAPRGVRLGPGDRQRIRLAVHHRMQHGVNSVTTL